MDEPEERASPGDRRERFAWLLPVGLVAVVLVNLWWFVGEQRSDRRIRLRRATDVEELAARSPVRSVRERHATYYRLARELRGATLRMDAAMAQRHRWALEGLGDMTIEVSRRSLIRLTNSNARPLIDGATWTGRLEGRKLHVLLDPNERSYVMSWAGKGDRARVLIVPLTRFLAASGKL